MSEHLSLFSTEYSTQPGFETDRNEITPVEPHPNSISYEVPVDQLTLRVMATLCANTTAERQPSLSDAAHAVITELVTEYETQILNARED